MADATNTMVSSSPLGGSGNQLGIDISSIMALISGLSGNKAATGLANIADPNLPYQADYAKQLNAFMQDPSSVLKDPAFQAAEALGAENISRQAGAAGMAQSGNRLAELYNYGITSGLGYEQQRFNQLLGLTSPGQTGSGLAANILGAGKSAQAGNLATGIAGVLPIIAQLLGLGGGGGGLGGLLGSIGSGLGSIGSGLGNWWDQNFGNFSGGAGDYNTGGISPPGGEFDPTGGNTGIDWSGGFDWSTLGPGLDWYPE